MSSACNGARTNIENRRMRARTVRPVAPLLAARVARPMQGAMMTPAVGCPCLPLQDKLRERGCMEMQNTVNHNSLRKSQWQGRELSRDAQQVVLQSQQIITLMGHRRSNSTMPSSDAIVCGPGSERDTFVCCTPGLPRLGQPVMQIATCLAPSLCQQSKQRHIRW